MDLFSLKGKTALVTGCNKGIGKAMAIGLATGRIILNYGDQKKQEESSDIFYTIWILDVVTAEHIMITGLRYRLILWQQATHQMCLMHSWGI